MSKQGECDRVVMKKWYIMPISAFFLTLLVVLLPSVVTPKDVVLLGSAEGNAVLGFIQLVALVIPALAIFAQAMHTYSYRLRELPGKAGGLGPLGPEGFRAGVWMVVGVSSFSLTMGLVSFFHVLKLPTSLEIGIMMIIGGIAFTTVWVFIVALIAIKEV